MSRPSAKTPCAPQPDDGGGSTPQAEAGQTEKPPFLFKRLDAAGTPAAASGNRSKLGVHRELSWSQIIHKAQNDCRYLQACFAKSKGGRR
jgi:hypothetical protein